MKEASLWIGASGVLSLVLAGITVITNYKLKKFEVMFRDKRRAFRDLNRLLFKMTMLVSNALESSAEAWGPLFEEISGEVYGLMPFMGKADHDWLIDRISRVQESAQFTFLDLRSKPGQPGFGRLGPLLEQTKEIREGLFKRLFA